MYKSIKDNLQGVQASFGFSTDQTYLDTLYSKIRNTHEKMLTFVTFLFLMHDSYTLFEKSNFCPKIQFCQNFTFFSGNQSCQQLKSANPQQFHEFFTQKFFDNFSREIKIVNS